MDVRDHCSRAHAVFATSITVTRGVTVRSEVGVIYPDPVLRSPEGNTPILSALAQLDVTDDVDIAEGDTIDCDSTDIVDEATTWTVSGQVPSSGSGGINRWWLVQTSPAPNLFYNATITVKPTTQDANGDPVLGVAVSVDCWLNESASQLLGITLGTDDQTVIATLDRELLLTDRVWLPADTVDTTPPLGRKILRVWEHWIGGQTVYLGAL